MPEGIEVSVTSDGINVKGQKGEHKKIFNLPREIKLEKKGDEIILGGKKITKKEKKVMNTFVAHIKNWIKGAQEGFEYQLKICSSHFPMTISLEGKKAKIKNFLGEKIDRNVKIPEGVEVDIKKEFITITSIDKELAGQAAANFEKATRVGKRDRRVFQDGIFIINKGGKEI